MIGVDIIGALLLAEDQLLSLVPADRIKGGALPDGIALPALLLRTVTSVDRQKLKRAPTRRTTDRTSVTVRAGNYKDQRAAIALVKSICAERTGDLGGAIRVSVLNAGVGPDVAGPANSFEQTIDFRVTFDAPS